jgi:GTP cyclohydrolase I
MDFPGMVRGMRLFMESMGIDLEDPNFKDTPSRVARLYKNEMAIGLDEQSDIEVAKLLGTTFPSRSGDMVVIRKHQCISLCPHHLLPVFLEASVGYIPQDSVLGLSKIPRLVSMMAARPMLQEDLGRAIIEKLNAYVSPHAIVVLKGKHTCMSIRGVRSTEADTVTSALSGDFLVPDVKAEFMELLGV